MSLVLIVDTLRARFLERGLDGVSIGEGREALVDNDRGEGMSNRIVIFEADEPGAIDMPMYLGEDDDGGRGLWRVTSALQVSIAAYDASAPSRYFAHRDRCLVLWEALAQEMQRLLAGAHEWTGWSWNTKRRHGAFGAELTASLRVQLVLRDQEFGSVTARPLPGDPKPVTP